MSIYIKGYHPQIPNKEYWWKAKRKLIQQQPQTGNHVWVDTQFGTRWIVVTEVLQLGTWQPAPSPVPLRMAYGLKKT